jgi:hypothetical protein
VEEKKRLKRPDLWVFVRALFFALSDGRWRSAPMQLIIFGGYSIVVVRKFHAELCVLPPVNIIAASSPNTRPVINGYPNSSLQLEKQLIEL